VAIDPAPCLGDGAFDLVDLLFWQAVDVETIGARASALAPSIDTDAARLLDWCRAFAGMTALELATTPKTPPERTAAALALASQLPVAKRTPTTDASPQSPGKAWSGSVAGQ
jgi:streptomycin 6-kinase